ncbi:MAG: ABC transporter permease [Sulfobacillus sp.]
MLSYVLRRIIGGISTVLVIILITFTVVYVFPVDPARIILGSKASAGAIAALTVKLGLNRPLYVQLGIYLNQLIHGNFGISYASGVSVNSLLIPAAENTFALAVAGIIAEMIIGIPIGLLMGLLWKSTLDRLLNVAALIGLSLPPFWLGILLLYYFAFDHRIFPLGGFHGLANISYYILPALTIGLTGAPVYARVLRTSMRSILPAEYVRTARAKGMSEWRLVLRHVMPGAVLPIITQIGLDFGRFIGGIIVIETVFAWPGIGALLDQAVGNLDEPTIMAITIVGATGVVLANLGADILYSLMDPRISYD